MHTLDALNAMSSADFVAALGDVFEHAAWVAEQTAPQRPFTTVEALHLAMVHVVRNAGPETQLAFIKAHPELGSKVQRADITTDSQAEQGSLGLDRLTDAEFELFQRLNTAYRVKFGIPFIIGVRRHTRSSILHCLEQRLGSEAAVERLVAINEIGNITRLRLVAKVDGPGLPKTSGRLSTHVLDTQRGKPAAGVKITLTEIGAGARGHLANAVTNADGRTDQPLIIGVPLRIGTYELAFHVADYFSSHDVPLSQPPFLDVIPIRFAISEPEGHYHVPLLVTPWSYSTYRGS